MSEMIERVARAICDGHTSGNADFDEVPAQYRDSYRDAARAAIEEMRIASDDMLEAASEVVVGFDDYSCGDGTIYLSRTAAGQAHRAMINAALKETP